MKIAVSSNGKDLNSKIDPRFGRCAYFLIVDTSNLNFDAFDNESIALGGGAGIQAAQFVTSKGAKAILTGHVGPNAVKALTAAGVDVFVGQVGTVREALERYKTGKLEATRTANVSDHYGMGDDTNPEKADGGSGRAENAAPGMGGGRGFGMGGARGRGMGRGREGSIRAFF